VTARRGEVWLVDFGNPIGREQAGRRPAVVVSADRLNESLAGVVIVVPCTTTCAHPVTDTVRVSEIG
jgi:mRNA interferase MazF